MFSGICVSMDDQRCLEIVDNAEKVWLENSLDPYVKSQRKHYVHLE